MKLRQSQKFTESKKPLPQRVRDAIAELKATPNISRSMIECLDAFSASRKSIDALVMLDEVMPPTRKNKPVFHVTWDGFFTKILMILDSDWSEVARLRRKEPYDRKRIYLATKKLNELLERYSEDHDAYDHESPIQRIIYALYEEQQRGVARFASFEWAIEDGFIGEITSTKRMHPEQSSRYDRFMNWTDQGEFEYLTTSLIGFEGEIEESLRKRERVSGGQTMSRVIRPKAEVVKSVLELIRRTRRIRGNQWVASEWPPEWRRVAMVVSNIILEQIGLDASDDEVWKHCKALIAKTRTNK